MTACHVPSRRRPPWTGIVSPGPSRVAWVWDAALPSPRSCRHTPAGTRRSSASSTSVHTLGSSFSLTTTAAVAWGTYTLHRPSATLLPATISATRAVRSIICRLAVVCIRSSVMARTRARRRAFIATRDHEGHPAGVPDPGFELAAADRVPEAVLLERVAGLAEGRRRLAVDVLVRLHVDGVAPTSYLHGLVGEHPRGSDRHLREEALDVLGVEAHAA